MKKIFSLVLALIIALSCTVAAFASDGICGFAVATDLHYVEPMANKDEYFYNGYFSPNENGNKYENESGFIIDEFLNQCALDGTCDFILVPGDLTTFGRGAVEHATQLADKFRKFEAKTGKQVYVINGNHDNGATANVNHTKFTEIYNEFGYDTAFSVDESCCSYATYLNDKYGLIALDSCDENYSLANGVSTQRLSWIKKQADAIRESGREIIMIMHHNLLEHSPLELIIEDKYIVSTPITFASLFADWGIRLVFTGHTHLADAVSHTSPMGNTIYDFCTTALTQYPFQYRKFEMTDDVVSYQMNNIKKIDSNALSAVVSGFTTQQLNAMATDLMSYEYDRLFEKTEKMLKETISAKGLGIDESSAVYDTVNDACEKIDQVFSMKLYGENSLSSLADEYGLSIPESEYNNVWELGIQAYLNFSSGKKTFSYDSAEINIVLRAAQLALTDYIATSTDTEVLGAINEIISGDIGLAKMIAAASLKAYGGVTPAQRFIVSIILPFADLYLNDGDGIDNNIGELKGFYADNNETQNVVNHITLFITRVIRYFKIALGVFGI